MVRWPSRWSVVVVVVTSAGVSMAGGAQYAVTDLGILNPDPNYPALPLWINDSGTVVGMAPVQVTYLFFFRFNLPHACLWRNGVLTDLGLLAGSGDCGISTARCVNEANCVVGLNYGSPPLLGGNTLHNHAFLWPGGGTMTDLGSITADANDTSGAYAINNGGHIVGSWSTSAEPNTFHAFLRWSNGMVTQLGSLGGNAAQAWDINDNNQVVGWADTPNGTAYAFFWQNGAMSNLGALPGYDASSTAFAINDSGQIVGSCGDPNGLSRAFLHASGTMTDLGTLPGRVSAAATDINNRGLVVGRSLDPNGAATAFLWRKGVMYDLNSVVDPGSGWVLKTIQGINNHGQIVGAGSLNGAPRGFLVRVYFLDVGVNDPNRGSVAVEPNQVFFDPNAPATLTATAQPGNVFDHWSGDASGSTNPLTIVMNDSRNVTANFVELRCALTLTSNPSGGGTLNAVPPPSSDGKYAYGTVVTLTADPAAGNIFSSWSDDASGPNNPTHVTMNGNKSATGHFVDGQALTLNVVNDGWGTVVVEPNLPLYAPGTTVTLTASPIEGKSFREWTIWSDPNVYPDANLAAIDSNLVLQLTMGHDYTVEAAFRCSSGLGPMLPLTVGLVGVVLPRRRKKE